MKKEDTKKEEKSRESDSESQTEEAFLEYVDELTEHEDSTLLPQLYTQLARCKSLLHDAQGCKAYLQTWAKEALENAKITGFPASFNSREQLAEALLIIMYYHNNT